MTEWNARRGKKVISFNYKVPNTFWPQHGCVRNIKNGVQIPIFPPLAFPHIRKRLMLKFCVLKNRVKCEEAHQAHFIIHNKAMGVPQNCGLIPHSLDNWSLWLTIQKAVLQSIPEEKNNRTTTYKCRFRHAKVSHCMETPVSPEQISQSTAAPLKGTKCHASVSLLFLSKSCFTHTWDTDKKICTVLSSVSDLDIFITISIRRFWWLCYEMISL